MEPMDLEVEIEIVPWTLVWETTDRMIVAEPSVIVDDEDLELDAWCGDWTGDPLATIAFGDLYDYVSPRVDDDRRTIGRLLMGGAATAMLSAIVMLLV